MLLRKTLSLGVSAVALSLGLAYSAQASTVLPVTNLTFNTFTGTFTPPKTLFTTAAPTDWAIGTTTGVISNLIGVGQQGSEDSSAGVYAVYNHPYSVTVPAGTNFYQADGNPQYESTITQTISGLTANTVYTISFQQASGQQQGFSGVTTEQWLVFLGDGGITTTCPGSGDCTVNSSGNVEVASGVMDTPSQGFVDWNLQNLTFPALPAADIPAGGTVLTFLAWGNNGSDVNEPPTVFLEGVNTPPVPTPEPATLSLLGAGLLGLGGIAWRRRNKNNAAA
jgi:hypothetical protein